MSTGMGMRLCGNWYGNETMSTGMGMRLCQLVWE